MKNILIILILFAFTVVNAQSRIGTSYSDMLSSEEDYMFGEEVIDGDSVWYCLISNESFTVIHYGAVVNNKKEDVIISTVLKMDNKTRNSLLNRYHENYKEVGKGVWFCYDYYPEYILCFEYKIDEKNEPFIMITSIDND